MRIILVVLAILAASISSASSATKEDVAKLVAYLISEDQPHGVLLRKIYDTAADEVQVVFVQEGKRYSIFYSGSSWSEGNPILLEEQWISIAVRPNGTSSRLEVDGFEDLGLDGKVDGGTLGMMPIVDRLDEDRKNFDNGAFYADFQDPLPPVGLQFESYWQGRLDEAVRDTLKFYGAK